MGVTIRKGMFNGLTWQPDGSKTCYSVRDEQIFPSRTRCEILDSFSKRENGKIWFATYIYDKKNKTLFLSNSKIR